MSIGKLFTKDGAVEALSSIGNLRLRLTHSSMLHVSMLLIILVIAATIRLLPMEWGFQLSEFDPYMHYRLTSHMVNNGFTSWTTWIDTMTWYPQGLNVANSLFPGLSVTATVFYQIASALNLAPGPIYSSEVYHPLTADPLFNFCIIFPVIMATLTVFVIYLLGRDIGGKEVGLFSALFLALSSSYISRTSFGFFDDETVGIFALLLFSFFFLRSIDSKRSPRSSIAYAVAGGLSLGYLFASWGAARYGLGITLVFVFAMLLLKRYSTRLFISYTTTFVVSLLIAVNIPRLGTKFLTEPTVMAVVGVFLVLCIFEFSKRITVPKNKLLFVVGFLAGIVILFVALSQLGLIGSLEAKLWATLFPGERIGDTPIQQLVQSVQEHKPATWGSFYYDLGVGILFVPVGLYFAVQNPTNRNVFLVVFGLTSIYFASSLVRLNLLLAPALSIIWALALVQMIRPFVTILREGPTIPRRKMRFRPRVGKEFSAGFIILMFILLTATFVLPSSGATQPRVIQRAWSPTTIAASSLPVRTNIPDWLNALNYMRVDMPDDAVVLSWWDYGYWISAIGNKTTLADNGTVNSTQISLIGKFFMSNEASAMEIVDDFNSRGELKITHVLIFITFATQDGTTTYDAGYGDEGKWRWMAKIPGLNDTLLGNYTLGVDWVKSSDDDTSPDDDEMIVNTLGNSTVMYKMMHYAIDIVTTGSSDIVLENFEAEYFSQQYGSVQWIQMSDTEYFVPTVCIYKILYDEQV